MTVLRFGEHALLSEKAALGERYQRSPRPVAGRRVLEALNE